MSTVKISQLPELLHLDTETSNTLLIGVDVSSGVTGQFTVKTLAEGLYANNVLNVGNNEIVFPGVIAQFVGNSSTYLQVNLQNNDANASADYIVTADTGNDSSYYIDMGIKNSTFNYAGDTASKPLDSYIYSQGDSANNLGGNLVIGTTSSGRSINFLAGGTANSDIIARMSAAGGLQLLTKPIIFADGTSQNTSSLSGSTAANAAFLQANGAFIQSNAAFIVANTPHAIANSGALYANGAFLKANAAFIVANTPPAIANSAALYANGAFLQANAAFTKANNALANATGTFAGDLTITGNTFAQAMNTTNFQVIGTANVSGTLNVVGGVTMNASLFLANAVTSSTRAAVTISSSANVSLPANDGYMLHITGKTDVPTRIIADSFGVNAYALFAARTARGNVDYPSAVQTGDVVARYSSSGYGTTKFQTLGTGRIDFTAAQDFTDANTGSQIKFWNCPIGSNTLTNILTLNGDSADFTGVVNPQKGFIYTSRLPVGNQTTIAINYQTDSVIKANLVADLTVTHSNFVAGKVVELWLVNSGGTNRTVTHGCAAINSTVNATTFVIPATSCAHIRYFSIDGDLANTYVKVSHA